MMTDEKAIKEALMTLDEWVEHRKLKSFEEDVAFHLEYSGGIEKSEIPDTVRCIMISLRQTLERDEQDDRDNRNIRG